MTGFEVELADMLAAELGVRAEFFQGPWQNLPSCWAPARSTSCSTATS